MTELKALRKENNLTQQEAAKRTGISLRSYVSYENDEAKRDTIKYRYLVQELEKLRLVDETHGILSVEEIAVACAKVFEDYPVEYCYLFGSYAKSTARETSDVDLLVSVDISGLKFFGMVERLRESLRKKVEVLDTKQLVNNEDLLNEVLKEGIRIYG